MFKANTTIIVTGILSRMSSYVARIACIITVTSKEDKAFKTKIEIVFVIVHLKGRKVQY